MKFIANIIKKYKNWKYNHATPRQRGVYLHKHYIPGNYKIGTECEIYIPFSAFGSEPYLIEIGNKVRITEGVRFCTHDGGMWVLRNNGLLENADYFGRIKIEDNVHIGWNSIIMPNVTIGHDSIIGCGAVVTKDIPPRSIAVGIPARVISSIDDYHNRYKDKVVFTKKLSHNDKEAFLINFFGLTDFL